MEIITKEAIGYIKPIGRLDANTSNQLDFELLSLCRSGRDIIVDLAECPYVSSAGIRILLKAKKELHAGQNELFLTGVLPIVFQVFEIAGLQHIFRFETSKESALAIIQSGGKYKPDPVEISIGQQRLSYQPSEEEKITLQLCMAPEILSYRELGFALGFGSLTDAETPGTVGHDFFVTFGNGTGFLPSNPSLDPDFRITSNPVKTGIPVSEALSFGEKPTGSLKLTAPGILSFLELYRGIRDLRKKTSEKNSVALLLLANTNKNDPSLSLILPYDAKLTKVVFENQLNHFKRHLSENTRGDGFIGITFQLSELDLPEHNHSLPGIILNHLTFENITAVNPFNSGMVLENPVAWMFDANTFIDGREKRLIIETRPGLVFEPHKKFLARLLYTDSSKLLIEPLHGGFSAQTFHVTSFDHEDRKMRPTVLKIAHRELISRESERCQQFALPYIFNNCAVALGSAYYGETMALRYNFVGIGGEANQLKWLTHYYLNSDISFLEPLFDKIFLQILKPWYGQPVAKTLYPFRDHDPTFTFFPHIFETVKTLFSISADEPYISLPETDQPILNPFWFLKHEYARHRDQGIEYLSGICHGDLNMQNILLDESMNVYLIDFSETKPRSVISDFARLEAIFMIDNAPVADETDMANYLEFIRIFYKTEHLDEIPEVKYRGSHTGKIDKNVALTLKMRRYALESARGNPDMTLYFFALLEWILPIICYLSLPMPQRRLSVLVSSILCEKILTVGQR